MAERNSRPHPRFFLLRLLVDANPGWSDGRAARCQVGLVRISRDIDPCDAVDADCSKAWLPSSHCCSNRRRLRLCKFVRTISLQAARLSSVHSPHCHRKRRLSPNLATVAVFGDRLSPKSATISPVWTGLYTDLRVFIMVLVVLTVIKLQK